MPGPRCSYLAFRRFSQSDVLIIFSVLSPLKYPASFYNMISHWWCSFIDAMLCSFHAQSVHFDNFSFPSFLSEISIFPPFPFFTVQIYNYRIIIFLAISFAGFWAQNGEMRKKWFRSYANSKDTNNVRNRDYYTRAFPSRKHAYSIILKISPPKNKDFQIKKILNFFIFLLKNIDCVYSLEPPHRGGSNEYPQSMFWAEIRKMIYTPVNPSFTI